MWTFDQFMEEASYLKQQPSRTNALISNTDQPESGLKRKRRQPKRRPRQKENHPAKANKMQRANQKKNPVKRLKRFGSRWWRICEYCLFFQKQEREIGL